MIYERMVDGVLIRYDGETGQLWRIKGDSGDWQETGLSLRRVYRGLAYLTVSTRKKQYMVHRLIWLIVTGEMPKGRIDHKDRNGLNNRWENLRDVDAAVNMHNSGMRVNNKSGTKGVCYDRTKNAWRVEFQTHGLKYQKRFKDKQEAIAYRRQLEIQHAALMQLPTEGAN